MAIDVIKVCPYPTHWMTVHKLLLAYREKQGWMITPPPEPLVLHGWAYTNDLTKKDRWEETIAWATKFASFENRVG